MWTESSAGVQPLWDGLTRERLSPSSATSCPLPPRYDAVGDARRFARTTLRAWHLEELLDGVELVASELVTNALRYALPENAAHGCVRLSLVRWSTRVVCAVRDPSSHGPVTKEADFAAESGRGLHLVESFSETWGWHPLNGTGKVVWALFRVPGQHDRPSR
jgi:anti-sigma regulatory factor (Ser/Thr protein kinase)